jgi:hypothetical protein
MVVAAYDSAYPQPPTFQRSYSIDSRLISYSKPRVAEIYPLELFRKDIYMVVAKSCGEEDSFTRLGLLYFYPVPKPGVFGQGEIDGICTETTMKLV